MTAVAKAEAYNPSGQSVPIQVGSVKPWLVANCDQNHASPPNPNCPGNAYFVDPGRDYAIANSGSFVGQTITLRQMLPGILPSLGLNSYYTLNMPISSSSASCPSAGAAWGTCGHLNAGAPGYYESVACADSVQLSCGRSDAQGLTMYPLGGAIGHPPNADEAVQCLVHASGYGLDQGQDVFNNPGTPVTIDGGINNPNSALRSATNISRSDSIVTVPIGDCPLGSLFCNPFTVIGFMQLGIKQVKPPLLLLPPGDIEAVILNVSGCGDAEAVLPVSGGGVSPVPVRLIQ